jgi:hypothetical protein
MSHLVQAHYIGNGGREAVPMGGLLPKAFATESRQRVELRAAVVLGLFPFRGYPTLLLEFVKCRIQRAIADLKNVARNLFESLADGPAVERLQGEDFEE